MMSNAERVVGLDEGQLRNLVEQANAKIESIQATGWTKLWTVSVGWGNIGWFPDADFAAAVEFACDAVKKAAAKTPNKRIEMEVELENYRPADAIELLARITGQQPQGERENGSG